MAANERREVPVRRQISSKPNGSSLVSCAIRSKRCMILVWRPDAARSGSKRPSSPSAAIISNMALCNRGEAAGMMVAVFVLMIAGVILSTVVRRLQTYLLRWRPAQQLSS